MSQKFMQKLHEGIGTSLGLAWGQLQHLRASQVWTKLTGRYPWDRMRVCSTVLVSEGPSGQQTELVPKAGIVESDMTSPSHLLHARVLAGIQQDSTLRTMLSLHLPPLRLDWQGVKAQVSGLAEH